MKNYRIVLIIGLIEILIGAVTILSNLVASTLSLSVKTPTVLLVIVTAGSVSTLLGFGLLKFNKGAYQLLLYFSSVIILSKFLIFLGVLQLGGALETTLPDSLKNMISIVYHGFIVYYLTRPGVKQIFHN